MSKLIHYSGPAGSILLPQGYTRLAYIEGNADAWFSAGIAATANTKYKIKFSAKNKGSWNMMFGRWPNCIIGINSSMHLYINGSDIGAIKEDEICDVTASYSAVYFKSKDSITCNKVSACVVKLAVFGGTNNGDTNNSWGYGKGRIYELKIWEGDTLIRDYVPAKNSSGVAGLLDLVDNSWHPSSTSKQFKAGPECPQGFPTSEYCQVEWLESTGTQYIQTDYYPTNNMQLQARACRMGDINDYQQLFGCRGGGATVGLFLRRKNDTNCAYDFNSRGSFSKSVFPNDTFVDIDINKNVCKVNGTQVVSVTASTFTTTTYPFLLFVHNNIGTPVDFLRGRVSRIKITDGSIQHDYISCYRRSDMKPGMYDLVGRQFYTNSGTGEFLLGPSITFGWGEVVNNIGAPLHALPHNISSGEGRLGINTAFDFSSTNAYLNTDGQTTGKTYMGWFYTASKPVKEVFFVDSSSGMAFGIHYNGTKAIISTANALNKVFTLSTWNIGWNHIAVVKADNGPQLYINGIAQTATSRTDGWTHSGGLWIGARSTFNNNFSGRCQDFKVFDIALTQAQIQQEM